MKKYLVLIFFCAIFIFTGVVNLYAGSLSENELTIDSITFDNSIDVTKVNLNKTANSIKLGETEQLTATVSPDNATNKSVTWSVSSQSGSNIATVSDTGLVTAVNPGTAVIRATSNADNAKYAECSITATAVAQDGDYTYTVADGKAQITGYTGAGGVVTIPGTLGGFPVTSIGEYAFAYCYLGIPTINIPKGVTSIGYGAFYWCTGLTSITVAADNLNYESINGVLYNKAGTILITCPMDLETISIPQGVTSIGNLAFGGCMGLKTISIPQGITSIGDSAFYGCAGLKTIDIPQGVTSIGNEAFSYCLGLTAITFKSQTTVIYDDVNTIHAATKIIGYDPSTAKDYANKYNRQFEVIGVSVDKTALTTAITNATILLASKTIGTAVGNVSQAAHDAYNTAITSATVVENNASANQAEVDEAVTALATATAAFNNAIIKVGTPKSIKATPSSVTLDKVATLQITITGTMNDGAEADVTSSCTFSAADSDIATVDASGLITAKAGGTTTITATLGAKKATVKVTVNPSITGLKASTESVGIESKASQSVKLSVVYDTGKTEEVTKKVQWSSENTSIATVNSGKITGVTKGSTKVIATYGGYSVEIQVTVTPVLVKLTASTMANPALTNLTAQIGDTINDVIITATYEGDDPADVTKSCTWSTSNSKYVDVNKTNGEITAITKGTATITASLGMKKATIKVNVIPKVDHLGITIKNAEVYVNKTASAQAVIFYKDNTSAKVTAQWSSEDPNIATVNSKGVIAGKSKGTTTITAEYIVGSQTYTSKFDVTVLPVLSKLIATRDNEKITSIGAIVGETISDIVITATYVGDDALEDVTNSCIWSSSSSKVAEVDNTTGVIIVRGKGTATITVTLSKKKVSFKIVATSL